MPHTTPFPVPPGAGSCRVVKDRVETGPCKAPQGASSALLNLRAAAQGAAPGGRAPQGLPKLDGLIPCDDEVGARPASRKHRDDGLNPSWLGGADGNGTVRSAWRARPWPSLDQPVAVRHRTGCSVDGVVVVADNRASPWRSGGAEHWAQKRGLRFVEAHATSAARSAVSVASGRNPEKPQDSEPAAERRRIQLEWTIEL